MSAERGFLERFIKEPVEKVGGALWKVGAVAAVLFAALGPAHTALKLAVLTTLTYIATNEISRSIKPKTA